MKGTACTISLPRNHRNGQFDGRDGVVEGLCHDGRISVRFENNTVFSFDAEHVVLKDQRLSAGVPGYVVAYRNDAAGAIGRVYTVSNELCGTFTVTRDWIVSVGSRGRVVERYQPPFGGASLSTKRVCLISHLPLSHLGFPLKFYPPVGASRCLPGFRC